MSDQYREIYGPNGVNSAIGQAITSCWHVLPKDTRSMERLDAEVRRIVERALKNVKEDAEAFGFTPDPQAE